MMLLLTSKAKVNGSDKVSSILKIKNCFVVGFKLLALHFIKYKNNQMVFSVYQLYRAGHITLSYFLMKYYNIYKLSNARIFKFIFNFKQNKISLRLAFIGNKQTFYPVATMRMYCQKNSMFLFKACMQGFTPNRLYDGCTKNPKKVRKK